MVRAVHGESSIPLNGGSIRMLFYAHSGLRYLVLVAGLAALVYLTYAAATKKGDDKLARVLSSAFVGLIDLQILLGLLLVVSGIYYPALIGHMFMMVAAAVVGHIAMVMAKGAPTERRNATRLFGVTVAMVLLIGGILAIHRAVFGTGLPSM